MPRDDNEVDGELAGAATYSEIRGWYLYDWANSPYYQVYVSALMPILLKWYAEGAAGHIETDNENALLVPIGINGSKTEVDFSDSPVPYFGFPAGSYPPLVNWVTIFLQTICLLSFSSFGDYGDSRKKLLGIFTYNGALLLILNIVCVSSSWWLIAGLLRILVGIAFILAGVYYNAYLPLLAVAHQDNEGLKGEELVDASVQRSDEMSSKGYITGYAGGLSMLVVTYIILSFFECDRSMHGSCKSQFDIFFWPNLCIAVVGVWWAGFGAISLCRLKIRPGESFPEGANMLCLGWKDTCETLCFVRQFPNTLRYLIGFMLWSDGLNTLTSIAGLLLDESGDVSLKSLVFSAILGVVGAAVGTSIILKVQQCLDASGKSMIMAILILYSFMSIVALCGGITAFNGWGFYLVMAPIMLTLGSLQAYSRSIYSNLSPKGKEAAMFSFYEITDKGSNLLGAGFTFLIFTLTKSYVHVFWYLIIVFIVAGLLLWSVDVDQGMADALEANFDGDEEEDEGEDEEFD